MIQEKGALVDVPPVREQRELTVAEAIAHDKILSFDEDTMRDGSWHEDPDLSPFWGTLCEALLHIKEEPLEIDQDMSGQEAADARYVGIMRMKIPASSLSGLYWEMTLNWTPEWSGKIPPGNILVAWQDREIAVVSPWQFGRVCPTCKIDIETPLWARQPRRAPFCNQRCPICQQRSWYESALWGPTQVRPPQLLRDCAEFIAAVTKRDELAPAMRGELAKRDSLHH